MENATREEVTRLLKRGLNHYGLGEIEAAIGCWEKARELDPANRAAADYLETAYEECQNASADDPLRGMAGLEASEEDDTPRTVNPQTGSTRARLAGLEEEPSTLLAAALDAYKAGELDVAWERLKAVADANPDRLEVQGYLAMVRSERARQWAREIGDQGRVLRAARSTQELMGMNLSPDEGFLLSQIDGRLSIEELLNLAADRVRTLEIIAKLITAGVVE